MGHSWSTKDWKPPATVEPNTATMTMMTAAMRATKRAYSTAVAPDSGVVRRRRGLAWPVLMLVPVSGVNGRGDPIQEIAPPLVQRQMLSTTVWKAVAI